ALKLLYHFWNRFSQVYCERGFLPETFLNETPVSLETRTPLKFFNVLAFSVQFELDYVNILRIIKNSGIPLYRKDRDWTKDPIIIVGGTAVTANPLVLAPFVDAVFQGEFEAVANELTEALFDRDFDKLREVPGIYLPDDPPTTACYTRNPDIDVTYYPTGQVRNVSDSDWREVQVLGGFLLQISKGCNRGCKFCLIGKISRGGSNYPMRERSVSRLLELAKNGTQNTKVNKVSLIGSGAGDYSHLQELLSGLNESGIKFSVPSIRADTDLTVINEVVKNGQRSLTIAPEVGSDQLRFNLAKRISNEQFFEFARYSYECGISSLKMYYILGLPGQTLDEIPHMVDFVRGMNRWYKNKNLNVTVGFFIPKRQTDFSRSYIGRVEIEEMERQAAMLTEGLKSEASLHMPAGRWSVIQTILSIGDERLAPYLEKIVSTPGNYQSWVRVLIDPVSFLEEMQEGLSLPLEIG
ncbi:MAG TPA: radical SAM protein, partial [Candidatus Hodarchaeales archaeon]|nr:radical SAM protein [Candidatus Hodarchaeales archaeon]